MTTTLFAKERKFWDTVYLNIAGQNQSPFTATLHENVGELIPNDVCTILDAGCGGGALMAYLAKQGKYEIQGLDLSPEGIRSVVNNLGMKACVGNVLDMQQFQDNSFDLVVCSEVIEHLTLSEIPKCINEMTRVARKYVITTTPFRENLDYYQVLCGKCRSRFHIVGHLHSIDKKFLQNQFQNNARSMRFYYSGKREWRSSFYADLMRSAGYNIIERAGIQCPICVNAVSFKSWSLSARMVGFGCRMIQRTLRQLGAWQRNNIITVIEV